MKKYLASLLFLFALYANAQTSTITATLTDSDGTVWAGCKWSTQFIPNSNFQNLSSYVIASSGTPVNLNILNSSGSCNSSGQLTITTYDNTLLAPQGSLYKFTLCPNASVSCSVTTAIQVAGASPSFTTFFNSQILAPRFPAVVGAFGYGDVEVSTTPLIGGSYFNVTTANSRIWNGTTFQNGGGGGSTITLTTTGSSGAATYAGGILNIPIYTGGGVSPANTPAIAHQWITAYNSGTGVFSQGQPLFSDITSTPTTLAGYGITDPIVLTTGSYANPTWLTGLAWSKINSTPTTISGYGITDPIVLTSGSYTNPTWLVSIPYIKITNTPTTLAGYGITDPVVLTTGSYSNPTWLTTLAWSKIGTTPTTLGGYGITDAATATALATTNANVATNTTSIATITATANGAVPQYTIGTPFAGTFGYASAASPTNISAVNGQEPFWPESNPAGATYTGLQVVFANAFGIPETCGPPLTITAQAEYPQGTFWPLYFNGSLTGTISPCGILTSTPAAFDMKAGNPGIIRYFVTRTSGTVGIPGGWTSSTISGSATLNPFTSTRTAGAWDGIELLNTTPTSADCSITSGASALTCPDGAFVNDMAGSNISVTGAGVAGATLTTSITSRTSATVLVLGANAGTTTTTGVATLIPVDKSGSGSILVGGTQLGFAPLAVLAQAQIPNSPTCLIGDSITKSSGQNVASAGGWAMLALSQALVASGNATKVTVNRPWLEMAQVSDTAFNYNTFHNTRYALLPKCKYVLGDFTNDVFILLSSAVTTETSLNTLATQTKLRGVKGAFYGTLTPRTSSTDNWLTAGNQTTTLPTQDAVRQTVNAWFRDCGPTDNTTGLPVAVGTSATTANRTSFYSLTGVNSCSSAIAPNSGPVPANHPFSGGGFFELTNALEVNSSNVFTQNGGFWRADPTNRTVTDMVLTNGSPTITSATASFTSGDNTHWVGGPGIPINTSITFVNSTTATMSKNATLTTAGETATIAGAIGNYVSQSDGVHPSGAGHSLIGTAVATWYGTAAP